MIGKNILVFAALCAVTLQHLNAAPQYRFRPQWRYDEIELHYNNPSPYKTGEFDPLNINQDYGSRVYQPPYTPVEVDSNENNLDNDIAHGFDTNERPAIIPAAIPERVDEQQMENDTPVVNPALIPEPKYEQIVGDTDRQKDLLEKNAFDNAPIAASAAIVPELALQEDETSAGITFSEEDTIAHEFNINNSPAAVLATLPEQFDDQQMENDTPIAVSALVPEPIYEQEAVDVDQQKDAMEENTFDNIPVAALAAIVPELDLQEDQPSARTTFSEEDDSDESEEIDPFAIFQQSFEDVAADDVARSGFVANEDEIEEAETKSNIVVAAEANNSKKVTEAENDENQVNDVTKNIESIADAEKEAESNVHELPLQEDEPNAGITFSEEDNIGNTFNTNDSPAVMQPTLPDPVNEQQAENDPPMAVLVLVPEPINEQEEANADQQRNTMEGNAFDDIPVTAPVAIVPEMDLQEDEPSTRTTLSEEDDSDESQEIFPFAISQQSSEESNEVAADDVARSTIIANKDEIEEAKTKSNIAVAAEVNNIIKLIETENDENQVNDVTENVEISADAEKGFEPIDEARLAESQTEISFNEEAINDFDATEPSNVFSQVNLDEKNSEFNINNLEEGAEKISDLSPLNDAQINIENVDLSSNIAEDTTEADESLLMRSSIKNTDAEPEIDVNQDEVAADETSGDNDFAVEEAGSFTSDAILADQGSGDAAIAFDAVENMEDSTELPDTLFRKQNSEQLSANDATETTVLLSQDVADFEFNPINVNADDGTENATEAV